MTIPASVTTIGGNAFHTTGLETLVAPGAVSFGGSAFANNPSLKHVTLGGAEAPADGTTGTITGNLFSNSMNLETVWLGEGITAIGDYGGGNGFYQQTHLVSIHLPSTLTSIGSGAFSGCTSLVLVTVPSSVTTIGSGAFDIGAVTNPAHIYTDLAAKPEGWDANWTSNRAYITVHWGAQSPDVWLVTFRTNGGSALASQQVAEGAAATPPPVPSRDGYDFDGWYADAALTAEYDFDTPVTANLTLYAKWEMTDARAVSEAVNALSWNDFKGDNTEGAQRVTQNLALPAEGLYGTAITWASDLLANITNAGVVTRPAIPDPDAIVTLTATVSRGTANQQKTFHLTVPMEEGDDPGDYAYEPLRDADETLLGYKITNYRGTEADVVVPATYNGYAIMQIGTNAFIDKTFLTSVTLPDSITRIGFGAFARDYGLAEVTLPEGLDWIETYAFADCTSLTSLTIPQAVTKVDGSAFQGNATDLYFETRAQVNALIAYRADWNNGNSGTIHVAEETLHTVVFDPRNGSPAVQVALLHGKAILAEENAEEISVLPVLTDGRNEFLGWFTQIDGGAQIDGTEIVTADVTYYAHWQIKDSVAVADVANALGWEQIKNGNTGAAGAVTSDLTLPVTDWYGYGTVIEWVSDAPGIIANDGTVTRPAAAEGNVTVLLDANVSKGPAVAQKHIYVVVLCEDETVPVITGIAPADGAVIGPSRKTVSVGALDAGGALKAVTLEIKKAEDEAWTALAARNDYTAQGGTLSADIPLGGFAHGDAIDVRAQASDAAGNASPWTTVCYTVDKQVAAPTAAAAVNAGEGETAHVVVSWTAPDDADITGFKVTRKSGGQETAIAYVPRQAGETDYSMNDAGIGLASASYIYRIDALDALGNEAGAETGAVTTPERTTPIAAIYASAVAEAGFGYTVDASYSWHYYPVASYRFDFGDGTAAVTQTAAVATHSYAEAGSYTVTLTVTDTQGQTSAAVTHAVTVLASTAPAKVEVTVRSDSGGVLAGMPVFFDLGSEAPDVAATGADGKVLFTGEPGVHVIGSIGDDNNYLPSQASVTLVSGQTATLTLVLTHKPIVEGTFEVTRMTPQEIADAGIDVEDPDNSYIVEITVDLAYGHETYDCRIVYDVGSGSNVDVPGSGVIHTGDGAAFYPQVIVPAFPEGVPADVSPKNFVTVAYLEIPVQVKALKDFYDVKLHILNNASEEYSLVNNTVTLNVPEGMTLMQTAVSEGATVAIDEIAGQTTHTVRWILRGDAVGTYDLTADYAGMVSVFNWPLTAQFVTTEPIEVRGLSDLELHVDASSNLADPLPFNVTLINRGDAPVYYASVLLPAAIEDEARSRTYTVTRVCAELFDADGAAAAALLDTGRVLIGDGLSAAAPEPLEALGPGEKLVLHYEFGGLPPAATDEDGFVRDYLYDWSLAYEETYGMDVTFAQHPSTWFGSYTPPDDPDEDGDEAVVTVGAPEAVYAGGQALVPVSIAHNPGFAAFFFTAAVADGSPLTLSGASLDGTLLEGLNVVDEGLPVSGNVFYVGSEEITEDGVLFYLVVDVAEDAAVGAYGITMSLQNGDEENFLDDDAEAVPVTFVAGGVNVRALTIPTAADLNFDTPKTVVYDGSPKAATVSKGTAGIGDLTVWYTGTGGTAYAKSQAAPTNAGAYAVTVDVAAARANGYAAADGIGVGTLTIARAALPDFAWPTASAITYGQPLSAATLAPVSNAYGTFAWDDADYVGTAVKDAGTYAYNVTFTMNAAAARNYEPLGDAGRDVTITVNKAPAPTITWPTASPIAQGDPLSASTLTGGSTAYGAFGWTNGALTPTAPGGNYEVTFTPSAATANNFEPISPLTRNVYVTVVLRGDVNGDGKLNAVDALTVLRIAVGIVNPSTLTAAQMAAIDLDGDGLITAADATNVARLVAGLAPLSVGTLSLSSLRAGAADAGTGIAPLAVAAAGPVITVGSADGLAQGESFTVPVTIAGNPGFAGMVLSVNYPKDALELTSIETTGAMLSGAQKDAAAGTIGYAASADKTGDGTLFSLAFTVKDGTANGSYSIEASLKGGIARNLVNAGLQTVPAGFSAGTVLVGRTIADEETPLCSLDAKETKVEVASMAWTGKDIKGGFVVTVNGETLTEGVDYTLAVKGSTKKIGKVTVTVTGLGKYAGTTTVTVKIVPKTLKVSKAQASGKGKLAVQWQKSSAAEKVTKYQLRYRVKGTKKWKTVTVDAKKTSYSVKNAKKGKVYEFEVRAVKTIKTGASKGTYAGAWSKTKRSKAVR
ncbi:MAG: leucine-rich repeat protein [Clostridiales Family XIII bacterium]|nr:leucine-rich repeat protein [Clostridiales Family XIII bacterium]